MPPWNGRGFASANASGAETCPMGVCTFVTEDAIPRLMGGRWIAGQLVNDVYEPQKDGAGNELPVDKQPTYMGGQKPINSLWPTTWSAWNTA